jgi:uncharacterized protein (DUF1684 family)
MKRYRLFLMPLIGSVFACIQLNAQPNTTYQQEIEQWYASRISNLKADNGWLNLVGLYWLAEGKNSFGSGNQNALVFPKGSINETAGYFERTGTTVKLVTKDNVDIKVNGKPLVNNEAIIYEEGQKGQQVVTFGSLQWVIIKRDDKIGVRLRDLKSPLVNSFRGVERFAVDSAWRIPAVLQTQSQPANIYITNILGQTSAQKSPGKLVFTVDNQQYTLDALEEGDELFIVFGDATSGKTTYPSGRFVYAKKPGPDGATVIDFNKAYNPPCAFTNYATCPLPPKQNILPFAVTAGEMNYGHQ